MRIVPGGGAIPCRLFICGERPGYEEVRAGRGFVGPAGRELWARLTRVTGVTREECYVTNLVKTYAPDPPTAAEVEEWAGMLERELVLVEPTLIVTVGYHAARWFLPQFLGKGGEHFHGLAFRHVSSTGTVATVVPVVHSSAALRQPARYQSQLTHDLQMVARVLRDSDAWRHRAAPPCAAQVGLADVARGGAGSTVGVDTEGSLVRPWGVEAISLSAADRTGAVVETVGGLPSTLRPVVQEVLDRAGRLAIHHAKHDVKGLEGLGLAVPWAKVDDTMLMAYLLQLPRGLKELMNRRHQWAMADYEDLVLPLDEQAVRETLTTMLQEAGRAWETYEAARKASRTARKARLRGKDMAPVVVPQEPPVPKRALTSIRGMLERPTEDTLRSRWSGSTFATSVLLPPMKTWKDLTPDVRTEYALVDALAHRTLRDDLWHLIQKRGLEQVYAIDMSVLPLLTRHEQVGMQCDRSRLERLSTGFREEFDATCEEINQLAGFEVNPLSGDQVSDCLFTELGLTPTKPTPSQKHYTTSDKYLKARRHEHAIVSKILTARQLNKYLGTYTEKLPALLEQDAEGAWRYFPDWKYTATDTGRLAERVIILIPKHDPLAKAEGRRNRAKLIRNAFHAGPGRVLVSVDLSQIELRVMAHLSQDQGLLETYRRGEDVHARVAHELLGAPREKKQQDESAHRLPAKCFHPDTEVLTRSGWKRIVDLARGEKVMQAHPERDGHVSLSWAVPLQVYTTRHPSQQLVHLKNEGFDLRVTPDHRMLGWRASGEWFVAPPKVFATTAAQWANSGTLRGQNRRPRANRHALRLAVALQADGSITPWGSVRWGFSKQRKIDRLRTLLAAARIPFTKARYRNGRHGWVTTFTVKKADARPFARQLDQKRLPWSWLDLPEWARAIVLDEAQFWDSHQRQPGAYSYSSSIRQNLDVLQALAAITHRKSRRAGSTLSVQRQRGSQGGGLTSRSQCYSGEVACLEVPSSFVLVRDRGVTAICGQTVNFGIINGMTEYGLLDQLHEAGQLHWTIESMRDLLRGWWETHPGVERYWEDQIAHAEAHGWIREALFGRRREVHAVWSTDDRVYAEAKRQCLFGIQSAADTISKVWNAVLWREVIQPRQRAGQYCEFWVRVHDDTTLEVEAREAEQVQAEMLGLVPQLLDIPTLAEGKIADRWGDL